MSEIVRPTGIRRDVGRYNQQHQGADGQTLPVGVPTNIPEAPKERKILGFIRRGRRASEINPTNSSATLVTNNEQEPVIGETVGLTQGLPSIDKRAAAIEDKKEEGANRFSREQSYRVELRLREVREEDIDTMIENGWFKDPQRTAHLRGDTINNETLPTNWEDPEQVAKLKDALHKFYFPGNPFTIRALNDKGDPIREAKVNRHSIGLERDGVLVGATSWLTGDASNPWMGDPWASEPEVKRKIAHTQMLVVDPAQVDQGYALCLTIARTEEIFKQGFNQITTWVNLVPQYEQLETFFESVGYEEDRGLKGKITINPEGRGVRMRRYFLTRKTWEEGEVRTDKYGNPRLVGRDASIDRWEAKKKNKRKEMNGNGSHINM